MKKWGKRLVTWLKVPENLFLTFALITGVLVVVILPPFRGPDEAAHIFRVYELSHGDIFLNRGVFQENNTVGNGYVIPDALDRVNHEGFNDSKRNLNERITRFKKAGDHKAGDGLHFQIFEGAGVYPPISYSSYLPTSILSRLLNVNEYTYTILLRLSGLLVATALIYLAIRIIPVGKWLLVAVGLLPMTIHQMSVVSTDGLITASSILFVAIVLYVRSVGLETVRKAGRMPFIVAGLFLLACIIASKPGYWPVLLIVGILVKDLRNLAKRPILPYVLTILVAVVLYITWYGALSMTHLADTKHFFEQANPGNTLISKREFVKQAVNPVSFVGKFYHTYIHQPPFETANFSMPQNGQPSFIFNTFVGSFASLVIAPPSWLSLTVFGTLFLALTASYTSGLTELLDRRAKILALIAAVGSFVLVSVIFWMSWTASDMPFIFGIQGRYFIPLVAFAIFFIPRKKILNLSRGALLKTLVVLLFVNCFVTLTTIYGYFYG